MVGSIMPPAALSAGAGDVLELLARSAEYSARLLKRSVPSLLAGVFVAELLAEKGAVRRASVLGRPFVKLSKLPSECSLPFTAAFLNARAAGAMLVSFYRENKISRRELYIAALMNSFPSMVRHWNSLIPVLLATLGSLGLAYFGILVSISLIQALISATAGRLLLTKPASRQPSTGGESGSEEGGKPLSEALRGALRGVRRHAPPILGTMVVVTYLAALLVESGFFSSLAAVVEEAASCLPLSPEELSIAAAYMASSVAAYTLGGSLLDAGLVCGRKLIRALLVGSLLANVSYLRVLIPYYVGVYGREGFGIMLASMLLRSVIALCFIAALGWL